MVEAKLEDIAVAGNSSEFLMLLSTHDGDIIPISIGQAEAISIALGKSKENFPRPLTHDLMQSMLTMLDAKVKRIEISELRTHTDGSGTYYARIVLENRGIEVDIDARPSDAVALAVRAQAPIFIADEVVEKYALTDDIPSGSGGFQA